MNQAEDQRLSIILEQVEAEAEKQRVIQEKEKAERLAKLQAEGQQQNLSNLRVNV